MGARYPARSAASVEDAIGAAHAVLEELLAMQEAARDPSLVRYLQTAILRQREALAFLIDLRRDMGLGARQEHAP